jgi:TolB-like protein
MVRRRLKISDVIIAVLLITVCILLYPKIFKQDSFEDIRDEKGRISLAVMPFENLTGDTTTGWLQRGISSLISNGLGSSDELAIYDDYSLYEALESMSQPVTAGLTPQVRNVASKLNVKSYITGDFIRNNNLLRINLRLIDTKSKQIITTDAEENHPDSLMLMTKFLSGRIRNFLEIKALEQDIDADYSEFVLTNSAEAYRHYMEGMNAILDEDYDFVRQSLIQAFETDTTLTYAAFYLAYSYGYAAILGDYQPEQLNLWIQKAYDTRYRLPLKHQRWLDLWHAFYIGKNLEDITHYCHLLEESEIESRFMWFDLAVSYMDLERYEKAVNTFKKIEAINLTRGGDWDYLLYYWYYGRALHEIGNHKKDEELFDSGLKIFGDKGRFYMEKSACAFARGEPVTGKKYLEKTRSLIEGNQWPRANIEWILAQIYVKAELIEKAEVHYRNAYEYARNDQDYTDYINYLSHYLIKYDVNMEEGLALIREGLKLEPSDPYLHYNMGLPYSKQDKLQEALEIFYRVEESLPFFSFELFQQIQEAEDALGSN